ncbi:unnamed protein product [Schistocephalus solidus]|uniref:C2H2-type domain-containing protein n=1 Tax=Schistocephalus solidus TaxID=70667 RepID=A0A183T4P7_SCHSO|nr:unnamed protein product [Schistocephalus solidus]
MGLFCHMRIHDSGIHRNVDNTNTPCTPSTPATATTFTTNDIAIASPDFSCPQCARNFNSRISLVGHLRIHRTEAGNASATSTHASAWSVTCESIARRLVNQCQGLRRIVDAPTSTVLTAPTHLHTEWTY